jgi:hypothetical protein
MDGCWASWDEQQQANTIRTDMSQTGSTKVRRVSTGIARNANVSRTFKAEDYDAFMEWYNVNCQMGVVPTRIITPYQKEEVWRFTEAPKITWIEPTAFAVTAMFEHLPVWDGL